MCVCPSGMLAASRCGVWKQCLLPGVRGSCMGLVRCRVQRCAHVWACTRPCCPNGQGLTPCTCMLQGILLLCARRVFLGAVMVAAGRLLGIICGMRTLYACVCVGMAAAAAHACVCCKAPCCCSRRAFLGDVMVWCYLPPAHLRVQQCLLVYPAVA